MGGRESVRSLKESSAFECNQAPLKWYQVPGRWRETDALGLAGWAAYRCEWTCLLSNYWFKCLISVFQYWLLPFPHEETDCGLLGVFSHLFLLLCCYCPPPTNLSHVWIPSQIIPTSACVVCVYVGGLSIIWWQGSRKARSQRRSSSPFLDRIIYW